MSKVARRRKIRRRDLLVRQSYRSAERFAREWEKRMESWLCEIRCLARQWRSGGADVGRRLFDIVDEAVCILNLCEPQVRQLHMENTHDALINECCRCTSMVVDRRLYRLSNAGRLEAMALMKSEGKKRGSHD